MSEDAIEINSLTIDYFRFMPKGCWDRPEKSGDKKGDIDANGLFAGVGRALTAWEVAEEQLAWLYVHLCEINDDHKSAMTMVRTFGSIEASGARLATSCMMLKTYLRGYLHLKETKWLMDEFKSDIRAAAMRRNEIAHGNVVYILGGPKDDQGKPSWAPVGHYLVSPGYVTGRNAVLRTKEEFEADPAWVITSTYCYITSDLMLMEKKFYKLATRITEFSAQLGKGSDGIPVIIKHILDNHEALAAREKQQRSRGRQSPHGDPGHAS